MLVRFMMKTWVKTSVTLVLAGLLSWFVISRDIIHSHGIFHQGSPFISKQETMDSSTRTSDVNWASADLFKHSIEDQSLTVAKNDVEITTETKQIMNINIFVRQALPPPKVSKSGHTILLLHGQRFTSKNWEDLGTMTLMAALGHRVVAIDLPGYGQSSRDHFTGDRAEFLKMAVAALSSQPPVIVSPSMSGTFSLPFLAKYSSTMAGYIPVAPAGSDLVAPAALESIMVPTVIVYGENDKTGLETSSLKLLKHLPNSNEIVLKEAGHAAYLDQPVAFHQMLYNVMLLLS